MRASFSKIALATLTALGLSLSGLLLTAPAQAAQFHGGGGGHGGGGWHGGGGGWHGGGWRGGGWRGGYGGWGVGILPGYGYGWDYGYPYDDGCLAYRPIYDRYGRYIGRRLVNVCY